MSSALADWDLIAAYLAVLRTGSLSGAARALGLSQPTLRHRIAALETRLGASLFTRGPAGLVPTGAGRELGADAEAMEAAAAAFRRRAAGEGAAMAGPVRIAASEVTGTEILPLVLQPLLAAHPDLWVEVVADNAVANLLRRDADVAVRYVRPAQGALVQRRVAPVPLGLFAAQAYLDRAGTPESIDDLASSHAFVGDDRRGTIRDGLAAAGLPQPERVAFRSDSDLAQLAAIRAGIGIGIAQAALGARAGLRRVLPGIAPALDAWVVMHEDLRGVRRVRAVFDALVAALG